MSGTMGVESSAAVRVTGAEANHEAYYTTSPGDLTGDGVGDFAVGSVNDDTYDTNAGALFVFAGQ